jgi:predicted nucleic acid-binding protein
MQGSFLDSNVLLYFASADPVKADRAEALMQAGGVISVQVLNEIASVSRRKFGYGWERIALVLHVVRRALDVKPVLLTTHEHGLQLAERHGFAVYDAMIVASALGAGCDTLWSEDMQDGMVVERRLTIRNPFRT